MNLARIDDGFVLFRTPEAAERSFAGECLFRGVGLCLIGELAVDDGRVRGAGA